jgi:hypothetical protein
MLPMLPSTTQLRFFNGLWNETDAPVRTQAKKILIRFVELDKDSVKEYQQAVDVPLAAIIKQYLGDIGEGVAHVQLLMGGKEVKGSDTPAGLKMSEEDVIVCNPFMVSITSAASTHRSIAVCGTSTPLVRIVHHSPLLADQMTPLDHSAQAGSRCQSTSLSASAMTSSTADPAHNAAAGITGHCRSQHIALQQASQATAAPSTCHCHNHTHHHFSTSACCLPPTAHQPTPHHHPS